MDKGSGAPAPRHGQLIVHAKAPALSDPGRLTVVPAEQLTGRSASGGAHSLGLCSTDGLMSRSRDGQDGAGAWTNNNSLFVWMGSAACEPSLERLPIEILLQVLGFLDVNDLLSTSRVGHHPWSASQDVWMSP